MAAPLDRRTPGAWSPAATQGLPRSDEGFTLIELLVVVVIIGILITIAIPLYLNYRRGANDRGAESDLRAAVHALELCLANSSTNVYPASVAVTGGTICTGQTVTVSAGTTFSYYTPTATDLSSYIIGSTSSGGSGKNYCYNSTQGGTIRDAAAVSRWRTSC